MRTEEDCVINYLANFGAPDACHHVSKFQILNSDGTQIFLDHELKKLTLVLMNGTVIEVGCPSDGTVMNVLRQSLANVILSCFLPAVLHGTASVTDGEPIAFKRKPE